MAFRASCSELETKYRDIADGNYDLNAVIQFWNRKLETKYRDIADGNREAGFFWVLTILELETKYRDIADGNVSHQMLRWCLQQVGNQVPRYSGWKQGTPRLRAKRKSALETKYCDIADGNFAQLMMYPSPKFLVGNQVPRYSGWKLPFLLIPCEKEGSWKPSTAI